MLTVVVISVTGGLITVVVINKLSGLFSLSSSEILNLSILYNHPSAIKTTGGVLSSTALDFVTWAHPLERIDKLKSEAPGG